MSKLLRGVVILWVAAVMAACEEDKPGGGGPNGGNSGVEPGVVKGLVVDTQGKPLPNLKVVVENTVFHASYVYATTGQDGRYRAEVPNGGWKVSVQLERQFQGRTYKFDLHPDNANGFTGTEGAIRNFSWKLSGPRPEGNRFYGGSATVYRALGDDGPFYEMTEVELTFTPDGPLIDGSTGQPVTGRPESGSDQVRDIPVGRYVITARHAPPGQQARPMLLRVRNTGTFASSVTALFNTPYPELAIHEMELEVRNPSASP
jgi:hypothetical protein